MRILLLAPVLLAGCPAAVNSNAFDTSNDGQKCDRIHGATGVVLYEDQGKSAHFPDHAPSDTFRTSGIAGPFDAEETTWMAVSGRTAQISTDGGCNWEDQGSLPAGDWLLAAAGTRAYAFDLASSAGARSDDSGLSWQPFDAGGTFAALPVVDPADSNRLRGVQDRGVVTSSDGGDTWSISGSIPEGATTVIGAGIPSNDLDAILVTTDAGVFHSASGGQSWNATTIADMLTLTTAAIHPADNDVWLVAGTDAKGAVIERTDDAGVTWDSIMSVAGQDLAVDAPIWPLPGAADTFVSSYGDSDGVKLYVTIAHKQILTYSVSSYFELSQIAFGSDRWLASLSAVPSE